MGHDAIVDFVPLCESWPVQWCCELDLSAAPVTGMAVRAASEYVWAVSGRQHGSCEVLVRPCRRECGPASDSWWWRGVAGGWPTWPAFGAGSSLWWSAVCGGCRGHCACNSADELRLDVAAQSVTSILIDGTELPASGYAFYNGDTLVRTDGERWPLCQDWSVPVSGVGAWSVTARFGLPVPELGRLAVGEVACQVAKHCGGDPSCQLPPGLQSQTRAGSTYVYFDPGRLREARLTGFTWVDRFVDAVNPARHQMGARIWNPDDFGGSRRPGGVQ